MFTTIQCTTRISELAIGDQQTTEISCNGNEVMTSCGFRAESSNDTHNRPGSYIDNDAKYGETAWCVAENMVGGLGVRAYARCCSFMEEVGQISCSAFTSAHPWLTCNDTSHKEMVGCTAYSHSNTMLGNYASYYAPVRHTNVSTYTHVQ